MAETKGAFFGGVILTLILGGIGVYVWGHFSRPSPPPLPEKVAPSAIATFADSVFTGDDVVPTGDGAAYCANEKGGVWYLKGGEAVRVKGVDRFSSDAKTPSSAASLMPSLQRKYRKERAAKLDAMAQLDEATNPPDEDDTRDIDF